MKRLVSAIYQGLYPFDRMFPNNVLESVVNYPEDLQEGDVLIVWGGSDIHPSLYKKGRSQYSWTDTHGPSPRDILEWQLMQAAKKMRIPIIGICRGAQMLCALAGGTLYQHVTGHTHGGHTVHGKEKGENLTYEVNSIHHQMMNLSGTEHSVLMEAPKLSQHYWDVLSDGEVDLPEVPCEPEFVYFPEVKGYAIQWHPEMMPVSSDASQHIARVLMSDLEN